MSKVGKVWGATECLLATPLIEVHRLSIKPQHQCSLHVHRRKWNAFVVLSGLLYIDRVKNDYPLTDVTELRAGERTSVPPGEFHRFRTGSAACEALEIYYPDTLSEDIERRGQGGPVEDISGDTVTVAVAGRRGETIFADSRPGRTPPG